MKALFRLTLPVMIIAALLLAGCSFSLPPNIPRTGGTPGAATLTAQAGFVGTGTPNTSGTAYPAVPTSTAEAGYPGAPTETAPAGYPAAPTSTTAPVTGPTNTVPAAAPTNTTVPVVAPTSTTAPTGGATATTSPGNGSIALPDQRATIQFPAGATSFVVTSNLQSGTVKAYQIRALNGQRMFVTIDGNATMQVYGPNLSPISGVVTAINPTPFSLNQTGDYYVAMQGSGPVAMSVYIPPQGGNQNIPAPVPGTLKAIQFQPGATSTSFSVNMSPGTPLGYTLNVRAGQQMTVTTAGNATMTLLAPDRATMIPSANAPTHQWKFPLSQNGNYTLVVLGSGMVSTTISIPALTTPPTPSGGQPTPIPNPGNAQRVSFGTGNASATLTASLSTGTPKAYVLTVLSGQTLYVSTTGSVDVAIYGPNNNLLTSGHTNVPNRWSTQAAQTGDYTFVIAGNGTSVITFYVPPK